MSARPTATQPPPPATSLSDRWRAWRDRTVASPKFRRWAAAFPLTRPIARRRASQLFDIVAGFVYSQVLLASVRLRVFDHLAAGPQGLDTLAPALGLPRDSARCLMDAGVALELFERRSGDRYGLGPLGAPMVGDTAIASMVEHHVALYADLADPVALLRDPKQPRALAAYWAYAEGSDDERVARYSTLMAASHALVADEVLDAYPMAAHRCLLDVGGGEGGFVRAVAPRWQHLKLQVFDLPAVARRAQERLARAGLAGRATAVGGDFLHGELPRGADLLSLVRVVHDHDDDNVMRLLRNACAALGPGGTLLLAEPMAGTPGAERMGDAYFGPYLLAMGSGRPRTRELLTSMLEAAGFEQVREHPTRVPLQTRVLTARVAHRPGADDPSVNLA